MRNSSVITEEITQIFTKEFARRTLNPTGNWDTLASFKDDDVGWRRNCYGQEISFFQLNLCLSSQKEEENWKDFFVSEGWIKIKIYSANWYQEKITNGDALSKKRKLKLMIAIFDLIVIYVHRMCKMF